MRTSATDVTVGLVVRAGGNHLPDSLPSLFSQPGYAPGRVIVVDETGDEDTAAVLNELARRYGQLEIVHNERPRGLGAARNQVLERVETPYLAWLEPDLLWRPRKLELQLARLDECGGEPVLCTTPWRRMDEAGATETGPSSPNGDVAELLQGRSAPPLGTTVGPIGVYRGLGGFDEALEHLADQDLLLRFARSGGRLVAVADHGPLASKLPGGEAPRAGAVVPAMRRLHRKHRDLARPHGRMFSARCRYRAHELAVALYGAEGRSHLERVHRLEAALLRLALDLVRTRSAADAARLVRRQRPQPAAPSPTRKGRSARPTTSSPPSEPVEQHHPRLQHLRQLAERGDWAGAVDVWQSLDDADVQAMTPTICTLAARSLRATGRYREAVDVALRGLERWPATPPVRKELYKSRAALTDWTAALRPAPGALTPADPEPPVGRVHRLGALAGSEGPVSGTVTEPSRAPEVSLLVNGRPVAGTRAAAGDVDVPGSFSINAQQVREYLGDGDALELQCLGRRLRIDGYGDRVLVETGYPSRVGDLWKRLDAGAVFIKTGQLRKGNTPKRKRVLLDLFERVSDVLARHHGYRCFPFYGNLLGAVRNHDLIEHDVGGFDMGYVSRERSPEAVRAEVIAFTRSLLREGFHVSLVPWAVMVRDDPSDEIFMDVNYAWFTEAHELQLSFGWRHRPVTESPAFFVHRRCPLHDRLVAVPGDVERLLEQLYGASWVIPDQGFELGSRLERAADYLLTAQDMRQLQEAWPERVRIEILPDGPRDPDDASTGAQGTKSSSG